MRRADQRPAFRLGVALAVALVILLCGCAGRPRSQPAGESGPSPKLNPFVHFEEGKVLFIGVDGRAAQYIEKGSIFPLGIGLANVSQRPLTLRRESFIIEDANGLRYPVVSQQEFNEDYTRSRTDVRLADSFIEILNGRFANFTYTPWRAFPFKGENSTVTDVIELGRNYWTWSYLYFPIPEDGIREREFNLLVTVEDRPEPFVVTFSLQ